MSWHISIWHDVMALESYGLTAGNHETREHENILYETAGVLYLERSEKDLCTYTRELVDRFSEFTIRATPFVREEGNLSRRLDRLQ